jgi:hypothetical protein
MMSVHKDMEKVDPFVVERLPSKHKAPISNPSTDEKKRKQKAKERV